MSVRRSGNYGFIDLGNGSLASFHINARQSGIEGTRISVGSWDDTNRYECVGGEKIIPYGPGNDLPGYVDRILSKFYAGEGILGKKIGLQWGEGPQLYRPCVDETHNLFFRSWTIDPEITAELDSFNWREQMLRCLVDLVHLEGFWVKITRTRASRIDAEGRLAKVEHVPASRVRYIYNGPGEKPTEVMVADFPNILSGEKRKYPIFNPAQPFRYPVAMAYYQIYSYNKPHYSVPRFVGAFEWIELAGTLAGILSSYNENASAISMHIESPQSYWDDAEARIKEMCEKTGETYSPKMLEDFKDTAMERFGETMTGRKNAGKFMHTSRWWNDAANNFEGWKITPIDKKIKDYIEAQVTICKKAEAAATSGFGLDPALSNLILDTKLGSGSEKLYSLKVYNATETSITDMVLCAPFQTFLEVNHPGTDLKIGLYRNVVEAEKDVNPDNRVKANI